MNRRLFAFAAILTMLLCSCGEDVVIEDETPDVVTIVEHVWHTDEIYHTIVEHIYHDTILVQEDTTPDAITIYEYPSGPVPCLVLTEGGVPAMADQALSGLTAATTINDPDLMLITQGGTSKKIVFEDFPMPTNYIGGLLTENNGTDADHDIDIAPGSCRDDGDDANLRLASTLVKQIDAAWAVGTNQGGLDTGTVGTDTLYAIWLIKRSDTGVVDALFSTSFTSPTMPTNYDLKRLIGAIRTDSADNILPYFQSGDDFWYVGKSGQRIPQDILDSSITNLAWVLGTLASAPPWSTAYINAILKNTTSTQFNDGKFYIKPTHASYSAATDNEAFHHLHMNSTEDFEEVGTVGTILIDESQQFYYAASELSGSADFRVHTRGFRLNTRREPK